MTTQLAGKQAIKIHEVCYWRNCIGGYWDFDCVKINNWNEFKKERKQEQKVLTELITSLEHNCSRMISDSINRSNWNRSSDIVIILWNRGIAYSDTHE